MDRDSLTDQRKTTVVNLRNLKPDDTVMTKTQLLTTASAVKAASTAIVNKLTR